MSESIQNSIIAVAGMKGHGKSTWLRANMTEERSLAIIDTLGEHRDWCPMCPAKEMDEQVRMLAEPPEHFQWSFMVSPHHKDENGNNLHFESLCSAAMLAGEMTLVIEEVDHYASANFISPSLQVLVDYGRHKLVNVVWLTRNLSVVPRILTSQTDLFVLFKQQEPRYLEAMEDRFTEEIVDAVEALPQFEYITVDREKNWERHKL